MGELDKAYFMYIDGFDAPTLCPWAVIDENQVDET
jgi:hypothetical protein